MESSAVAFIVRGALRADRLAVRPLSAQCGAALRSISAAVRSICPQCGRFSHRTAVDFPRFRSQCGPQTPHRGTAVRSSSAALRPRPVTEPRPVTGKPLPTVSNLGGEPARPLHRPQNLRRQPHTPTLGLKSTIRRAP